MRKILLAGVFSCLAVVVGMKMYSGAKNTDSVASNAHDTVSKSQDVNITDAFEAESESVLSGLDADGSGAESAAPERQNQMQVSTADDAYLESTSTELRMLARQYHQTLLDNDSREALEHQFKVHSSKYKQHVLAAVKKNILDYNEVGK